MSLLGFSSLALAVTLAGPLCANGANGANGVNEDDDWPIWRGPAGNGIAPGEQSPPITWDEDTNVKWSVEVPGRGHSSPTIVGNKIFLTTAEVATEEQSFLCYDRETGELLWKEVLNTGGFNPAIHKSNTQASPSIVTHNGRLFGSFNNHDGIQLICMDFDGKVLWQKVTGEFVQDYPFGYATTPCLYKDTVIVVSEYKDGFMAAFSQADGKELWRQPKAVNTSYASPVIYNINGQDQMYFSGCNKVFSYDPKSGKELWSVDAPWDVACGTIVTEGDLIFVSGGYPASATLAIKADGSEVVWQNKVNCYEQSMLVSDGYLYAHSNKGKAYCWNAKTGEEMWNSRLRGPVSSSPVLAGGNLYMSNERGTTYVIKADPAAFELVGENQLLDACFTSPTILNSEIFTRVFSKDDGDELQWLYCLAMVDEGE